MLYRIASGQLLGPDQPVILQLIELPGAMNALKGVVMELQDCAFPLLRGIVATDNVEKGFEDISFALLVGSKPRGPGMERGDLLKDNGAIFTKQGAALNKTARKDVKVLVVGNPANTNCLIAATAAKDLSPDQFSAMMRLDQDRAMGQLAEKTGSDVKDIDRVIIWGNHSANQYPDLNHARINGKRAMDIVNDEKWVKSEFIPRVQKRGAEIIAARGASSAASAGSAAIHCMRDWALGTKISRSSPRAVHPLPHRLARPQSTACATGRLAPRARDHRRARCILCRIGWLGRSPLHARLGAWHQEL